MICSAVTVRSFSFTVKFFELTLYRVLLSSQREGNVYFLFIWAGHLSVSDSVSLFEKTVGWSPSPSHLWHLRNAHVLVGFSLISFLDCRQEGKPSCLRVNSLSKAKAGISRKRCFCLPCIPAQAGLKSDICPVFAFYYSPVIMAVIRGWRVARGPSDASFNELPLEEPFSELRWRWEMWGEVVSWRHQQQEGRSRPRIWRGSRRKSPPLQKRGRNGKKIDTIKA